MSFPSGGQAPAGRLEARVASVTDPAQAYALYLPPGYRSERRWPVVFVLDPRGRALLGVRQFEGGAARLGWIILSSYNTLSDGPAAPNVAALNAMLASAQARLSIDTTRLYLAGFSGTARLALRFAVGLKGYVAGVIAVGGALVFELDGPETTFAGDSTFAVFAAAGTGDFNHGEIVALGERLRVARVPFRVAVFEGPHDWPPAGVGDDALEWLELRAMVGGLRAMDSGWVRARLDSELVQAMALERDGLWDAALRLADGVARDYPRWPQAGVAAGRAAALRRHPIMRRHEIESRRLAETEERHAMDLAETLSWARVQRGEPALETLTRRLHLADLQRTAERGDSLEAASARRRLARVMVHLAFYEPRAYLTAGAPSRALRMFEVAARVGPIRGEACVLLLEALAAATAQERARFPRQCVVTVPESSGRAGRR